MGTYGLGHGVNWTRCCVKIMCFSHISLPTSHCFREFSCLLFLGAYFAEVGVCALTKGPLCRSRGVTKATFAMCREAVGDTARESDIRWRCFWSAVVIVVSQPVDGCSLFLSLCPFTQPCFTFSCDRQQQPLTPSVSRTNALCIR